jgi:hypothetical protein
MESGNVKTFILAGVLTVLLFLAIYGLNGLMDTQRQSNVEAGMGGLIDDMEDIEASYYLMQYLEDQNTSCDSLITQMNYLEAKLWKFDEKIKNYKDAQEEFGGEEFYIQEKNRLNRREVMQLSILGKVKKACSYNHTIILYFYGNCKTVPNCGEQGFVLNYFNEMTDNGMTILSFDGDRDTQVVNTLMKAYNVTSFPCLVVEDGTYCGLRNRDELQNILCDKSPYLAICSGASNKTN